MSKMKPKDLLAKRKRRQRARIARVVAGEKPRFSVHRTGMHIYAQVIDDVKGTTLAAASSMDKELKGKLKSGANVAAATTVGTLVATRAKKAGISAVVFDRSGFRYHGRIKALADAARAAGLEF